MVGWLAEVIIIIFIIIIIFTSPPSPLQSKTWSSPSSIAYRESSNGFAGRCAKKTPKPKTLSSPSLIAYREYIHLRPVAKRLNF